MEEYLRPLHLTASNHTGMIGQMSPYFTESYLLNLSFLIADDLFVILHNSFDLCSQITALRQAHNWLLEKMRLYSAVIYLFVCTALAVTNFINPPANGTLNDFRDNPVYRLGDRINIQWESDRQGVTISVIFPYLNPRNDIGAFKGIDCK